MRLILSRHPQQAAARKAYCLIGLIFWLFALIMGLMGSLAGVLAGFIPGSLLLGLALLTSEESFAKWESRLNRLSGLGNF